MTGIANQIKRHSGKAPFASSSSSHRNSRGDFRKSVPSSSRPAPRDFKPQDSSSNPKGKELPSSILGPSPGQGYPILSIDQRLPFPSHHPGALIPYPPEALAPPLVPTYGFHMLERRPITLVDGSVRSFFALPPDYRDFDPPRSFSLLRPGMGMGMGIDQRFPPVGPMIPEFGCFGESSLMRERNQDYWTSLGLDGRSHGDNMLKRRYGDDIELKDEQDQYARQRQKLLQYGNADSGRDGYPPLSIGGRNDFIAGTSNTRSVGVRHNEVDQDALRKAFFHFLKSINENAGLKKNYLENGKQGTIQCAVCSSPRSSKGFQDVHNLVMHAYNSEKPDFLIDHLGLHKAICVLMGWSYSKAPDSLKSYQLISVDDAAANQDDPILWPPVVIIMNTSTGKGRDGRFEGPGNRAMDTKIRDLGFGTGKAKNLYGKEGHMGVTLIKFPSDKSGLKEAIRLSEHFEKENHGRKSWASVQSSIPSREDETDNPNLVKLDEKTGEKDRVHYGFVGTAFDLDKLDFDARKKFGIESKKQYLSK